MGGHIFPQPKRGGSRFFLEFNIKYFFKNGMQFASCTTEPLFVSLSNTDLQIFCLIH